MEMHKVEFRASGRGKAQCPPNPNFPEGIDVSVCREGEAHCKVTLPYPAPECGVFIVDCAACNTRIAITAAGRQDDPRSVTIPCLNVATGVPSWHYLPQGACDTTCTPRFANPECTCQTYPDNLGPCSRHEVGSNGRCVYCDHALTCLPQNILEDSLP